jgi:hypothetical protein
MRIRVSHTCHFDKVPKTSKRANVHFSLIAYDGVYFAYGIRLLPEYGLDVDDIHLIHSGWENLYYVTGHEAMYGMSLQNLTTLAMLDEIRHTLAMG